MKTFPLVVFRLVSQIGAIATFVLLLTTAGLVQAEPGTNTVTRTDVNMRNACINYLRQIDGAKQQWALENHKDANATPTSADVAPYLKNNQFPVCPAGGKYTIGRISEDPTCSIPGHVLPTP